VLSQCKLNRRYQILRGGTAVQVHVPAPLDEPVFEVLETELVGQQILKLLPHFTFPNHERVSGAQLDFTRSQEISYFDANNQEVARVHQYLKPDGNLGGSGRPDPKRVFQGGVLYRLTKQREIV
jgi:hypothetical protein